MRKSIDIYSQHMTDGERHYSNSSNNADNPCAKSIVIIGGGLTGATLWHTLNHYGLDALLVDEKPFSQGIQPDFDARTLALSPSSQTILAKLGIWQQVEKEATPLRCIEASHQFHFGRTRLKAPASQALGFVIALQTLNEALIKTLPSKALLTPASVIDYDQQHQTLTIEQQGVIKKLNPKLIVAADGTASPMRSLLGCNVQTKIYDQQALVANIGLKRPHQFVAHERFTEQGAMALLPTNGDKMALVWAQHPDQAAQRQQMENDAFLACLQQQFGYKLGRFTRVGRRTLYPIKQTIMAKTSHWPVVFVGNAAQTLHPIAGQGFNLALRDVTTLAECIRDHGLHPGMLDSYQARRKKDRQSILQLTNGLMHFFTNPFPAFHYVSSLGLIAMDNVPLLQQQLMSRAKGFWGQVPELACSLLGENA